LGTGDLPQPSSDIVDAFASLVDNNSLIQPLPAGFRFRMLATGAEYAVEQLLERGEEPAARRAHAAYFLAMAERADPDLQGYEGGIAEALAGLAASAAALGQAREAATLFGAADAVHDGCGRVVRQSDRPTLARDIGGVRAQLGEAAFEAAWTVGRMRTVDEAVADARAAVAPAAGPAGDGPRRAGTSGGGAEAARRPAPNGTRRGTSGPLRTAMSTPES